MGFFKNYSPDQVVFSFNGVNVTGYFDGTFIEVERDEDSFTKHVGALGDVTRTRNLNRSGKVTVTLKSEAPVNDILAALNVADEQFGLNYGAMMLSDLNGNMLVRATQAWIMKAPKVERAKESGSVQWVFDCADLFVFPGGNIV